MHLEAVFNSLGFTTEAEKIALIKLLHAYRAFESDIYTHLPQDKNKQKHLKDAKHDVQTSNLRTRTDSISPGSKVLFTIPFPEQGLTDQEALQIMKLFSFPSHELALDWFNHFGQAIWFRGTHIETQQMKRQQFNDYVYGLLRTLGFVDDYHNLSSDECDIILVLGAAEDGIALRAKHLDKLKLNSPYVALLGTDRIAWPIHEPSVTTKLVEIMNGKKSADQINAIFYTFLCQSIIDPGNFFGTLKAADIDRNSELSPVLYNQVLRGLTNKQSPIACIKNTIKPYIDASALASKLYHTADAEFLKIAAQEININHFRNAITHHFTTHEGITIENWPREVDIMKAVFHKQQKHIPTLSYDVTDKTVTGDQIEDTGIFSICTTTKTDKGNRRASAKDTLESLKKAIETGHVPAPKDRPLRIAAVSLQPDAHTQHMTCKEVFRDKTSFEVGVVAPAISSKTPNIGLFLSALAATTYSGLNIAREQLQSLDKVSQTITPSCAVQHRHAEESRLPSSTTGTTLSIS